MRKKELQPGDCIDAGLDHVADRRWVERGEQDPSGVVVLANTKYGVVELGNRLLLGAEHVQLTGH